LVASLALPPASTVRIPRDPRWSSLLSQTADDGPAAAPLELARGGKPREPGTDD
jgi:hypothetical protein